jgi:metal-sulfur cluster biosynthetic enzyme
VVKEEEVLEVLSTICDPEIPLDIVNLGLIEDISVSDNNIYITMTLTTPNCPLRNLIKQMIETKIKERFKDANITINLVFDKPWNTERISKQGKEKLKSLGWNL